MSKFRENVWRWCLGKLQRRCHHPSETVSADIAEGMWPGHSVMWCRLCGAVQFCDGSHVDPDLRELGWAHEPRANWWFR